MTNNYLAEPRLTRCHRNKKGAGAPKGNRNAWKSGLKSAETRARRAVRFQLLRDTRELIKLIEAVAAIRRHEEGVRHG